MKVVLLENIENIGKRYEIKEVADGYARNFLIPKGLAKLATDETIEWANDLLVAENVKAADELEEVGETAANVEGMEVEILVKVGDKGQLFEKIDQKDIADKLKEMGFKVDKKQVLLDKPIEETGEFDVKINFAHNLESEIKVIVSPEPEEEKSDEE